MTHPEEQNLRKNIQVHRYKQNVNVQHKFVETK